MTTQETRNLIQNRRLRYYLRMQRPSTKADVKKERRLKYKAMVRWIIDAESLPYKGDVELKFTEHSGSEERQTNSTDQEVDMTDDDDDDDAVYLSLRRDDERNYLPSVPVVFPRQRYSGARNVATIKDGPNDEFVASGSDDGNFFLWRKATGALHGIYEGDGSVVNMIEGHPHLPLIAVSGIDHTIK
ncbi:hypothetical protein C0993_008471, partial [Termitomyces sp. T159_Od127]